MRSETNDHYAARCPDVDRKHPKGSEINGIVMAKRRNKMLVAPSVAVVRRTRDVHYIYLEAEKMVNGSNFEIKCLGTIGRSFTSYPGRTRQ